MQESKADLKELRKVVEIAKEPRIKRHPYYPVLNEIFALRLIGVRHTYIAEYLNTKFKTKITNNQLSDLVGRWKKQGLYSETRARAIADEILKTKLDENEKNNEWSPL